MWQVALGVQLSPAVPSAGVGMGPELQRGLTEPGKHLRAWPGMGLWAAKVTPKLQGVPGGFVPLDGSVSVHMDVAGKGLSAAPCSLLLSTACAALNGAWQSHFSSAGGWHGQLLAQLGAEHLGEVGVAVPGHCRGLAQEQRGCLCVQEDLV